MSDPTPYWNGPPQGLTEKHEAIAAINERLFGPATSFSELPRDEKQKAYELANDGHFYGRSVKLERRIGRNHKKAKWIRRHSQIKAAAKKRGKPFSFRSWLNMWTMIGLHYEYDEFMGNVRLPRVNLGTFDGIDRGVA